MLSVARRLSSSWLGDDRPTRTLKHHTDSVTCLAFSPTSALFASGSRDTTVALIELTTGRVVRTITHASAVRCVAFSPDGRVLATGVDSTDDGTPSVVLTDTESGKFLQELQYHSDWILCVAFSPDGGVLATGSEDKSIVLVYMGTTKVIHTLTHHTSRVNCLAFSPDGSVLASGSRDNKVVLVEPISGTVLRTLTHHTGEVKCLAFSPDGIVLASGSFDKSIVLVDVRSASFQHGFTHNTTSVNCVAFSPDNDVLASGSLDALVTLVDSESGKVLHECAAHAGEVNCMAFSADGHVLASGSFDNTVVLAQNKVLENNEAQVMAISNDDLKALVKRAKSFDRLSPQAVSALCKRLRLGGSKFGLYSWITLLDQLPTDAIPLGKIKIEVQASLDAEYSMAIASSSSATVSDASTCLRQHIEAMLCKPLQSLVDAATADPKCCAAQELSELTEKLLDAEWWYPQAVIAPMLEVYASKLLEEVRTADLDTLRRVAEHQLDDDLKIYSAIHDKERNKPEYAEFAAEVKQLEAEIRAKHKVKPLQPSMGEDENAGLSVAQVKAHAADAHAEYCEVILAVAAASKADVKIPPMKGAYRMMQKSVRSSTSAVGNCRSICDVNRSLLTAETPAHARLIVTELMRHPAVEIKWMKDRVNHPTDGGWCDVLFLFTVAGGNGHVCEVQIAFKNMISQRTAGESHKAYAQARDAIETIEAAGCPFVKQANTDIGALLEDHRKLAMEVRELTRKNQQLQSELDRLARDHASCAELHNEVERLKQENAALRAGALPENA